MSALYSFDECHCQCHTNPSMHHCMPCCHTCPHCGKNIKTGIFYESHVEHCEKEQKEFKEMVEGILSKGDNDDKE